MGMERLRDVRGGLGSPGWEMEPNLVPKAGSLFEKPTGLLPRTLEGDNKRDTPQKQRGTHADSDLQTKGLRAPAS